MLGRFYSGVAEGRRRAEAEQPDAVPPLDAEPAPASDEPAPAQPRAEAPFVDGDLAPRPIVTFHTSDLAPRTAPATVPPPPAWPAPTLESPTPTDQGDASPGLTQRVRGAQVPTTSGRDLSGAPSSKSPVEVQAMLDRFRSGVQKGTTDKLAGLVRYLNEADQQED